MPIESAFRLKLDRADHHLAMLSEEIYGFLASNRLLIPTSTLKIFWPTSLGWLLNQRSRHVSGPICPPQAFVFR